MSREELKENIKVLIIGILLALPIILIGITNPDWMIPISIFVAAIGLLVVLISLIYIIHLAILDKKKVKK